jgi:hypothetical protein
LTLLGDHTKNIRVLSRLQCNFKALLFNNNLSFLKTGSRHVRRYCTGAPHSHQLGYYLAGLIEGDGSIILRKGEREKISPKIVFTFGTNELIMYEKLQKILNTGSINVEKKGVCRYSITNAEAVISIINLVNGKFRTPKIQALYKAIDNLNKWRNANIIKLPLDNSNLDSNA